MDKHASDDSKMYECSKCPKKFARKSKLTLHQSCHIPKEEKNFKCLQCDKMYFCNLFNLIFIKFFIF